jgi:hypothetical protein
MTPTRVTHVQLQHTNNTTRWQNVKAVADAQATLGSSATNIATLGCLGLAYLATPAGATKDGYATAAGAILHAYCTDATNDPPWLGPHTGGPDVWGYYYRFALPLITAGMDWCYDGLTTGQRQEAATWLMNAADWVWPESNNTRTYGTFGFSGENNYYWGFLMTGPAALAAKGDDTGSSATTPGSGADRPQYFIDLMSDQWTNVVVPYFAAGGDGGAWVEGTNYGSSWGAGRFADAFMTAGSPFTSGWFDTALLWMLHATTPDMSYKVPIGEQPRDATAALYYYDRCMAFKVETSVADSARQQQIQKWLNDSNRVPWDESAAMVLAEELLHYDPSAPAASDLSALALTYYAPGAGFLVYRNSWTDPDTTLWAFQSSPLCGHSFGGDNSLRIWKGAYWLSCDTQIYGGSMVGQNTASFTGGTITGTQLLRGGGTILAHQSASNLVAVSGQAYDAYTDYAAGNIFREISDFKRRVIYLPTKDTFIVVDDITATNTSIAKVLRWHQKNNPDAPSGMTFKLASESADFSAYGKVWLPASGITVAREAVAGTSTTYAVTVTAASGTGRHTIVTSLQLSATTNPNTVSAVSNDGTNVYATVDGLVVTIPLDGTSAVTVA